MAVIGAGTFLLQWDSDGTPQAAPKPSASGEALPDLAARVQSLLQSDKADGVETAGAQGMSPRNSRETTLRDSGTAVPSCVQEGIGRPETALATRPDKYNDEDAYLVVLPHPGDVALVDAYLVSSACEASSPPVPGKVLVNRTVPRG